MSTAKTTVPYLPESKWRSSHPLELTAKDSILQINNDGVSSLQAGNPKAAMVRLASCLAIMKSNSVEGDKKVHYRFLESSSSSQKDTSLGFSSLRSTFVFTAPIEIVRSNRSHDIFSSDSTSNDTKQMTCKLLSIVLFNLTLAHHLYALEIDETEQYQTQDSKRSQEVRSFLDKSLRLYELCYSSLVFTTSGILCSDLSIAVVVTNNVGEIHKELHHHRVEQHHQPEQYSHEYSRTAMACSEQLVQIFMFFTANGAVDELEGLGDLLSNALSTLNGPQIFAPAA
eukprot:CAMPEP_0201195642 /NCGR_PEP_ID=MMETSP0851-20130426/151205_1 /ASSEMBLY_ACC=CAM_ASM_000631 /TAXON_ID=183588 /ORGANISM="Pseudo-nitzschia fraudulenta, Strain WWA7" /LENGTH=283 /DNA_ID=CAMNT_0047482481 /DNA_START=67 /DNA_END=918 /DNA_ORIENTATION=-